MEQAIAELKAKTGARRLTAAQRRFKKAIQYRTKHGVSLKAAFRAVKGGAEEEEKEMEEAEPAAPAMGARRRKTRKGGASLSPLPLGGRRRKTKKGGKYY